MKTNSEIFDNVKVEAIVAQLLANAAGVRYGAVSVSAKLHEGRLVEVSFSRTERTRDLDNDEGENQNSISGI